MRFGGNTGFFIAIFCTKTYPVGTHWNCLCETIPVSSHKVCFGVKIMKIISSDYFAYLGL